MASLRRSRNAPTEDPMAKFLYTILKQMDLKSIDWQEVANGNGITNGHAARMRYSRFKAQMEGLPATTRKPRTATRQKKAKVDKPAAAEGKSTQIQKPVIKGESALEAGNGDQMGPMQGVEPTAKLEPLMSNEPTIKSEPEKEASLVQRATTMTNAEGMEHMSPQLAGGEDISGGSLGTDAASRASSELRAPKEEPVVKPEPVWEEL